ncbi:unnamed protein product [Effrenium voratum]|nr:unnamed protein product [Effrenium voratum]
MCLDVFFCSALVTCCARAAAWPGSLQLLADTRHHRVEPNAATFSSAVNACGGRWEQGLGALRHASLLQLQLNTICLGAACALDLGWPKAATLLAELCEGALEVSATACNSAVSSCTRGTSWWQGLQVAFGMLERHLRPSRVTFNAGISACDAGHDGLMGLKLLRAMDGSHLQPDIVSYNAANALDCVSGCLPLLPGVTSSLFCNENSLIPFCSWTICAACFVCVALGCVGYETQEFISSTIQSFQSINTYSGRIGDRFTAKAVSACGKSSGFA